MAYLPFADVNISTLAVFTIGLLSGILEGVFGRLSNLAVVPFLSLFGLPLSVSVSTNIGHSFGRTSRFIFTGNRNGSAFCRTGVAAGIFGLPGVFLGFRMHLLLAGNGLGEAVIKILYALILLSAAVFVFLQWRYFSRHGYYDDMHFPPFGLNWRFPLTVPGGSGTEGITIVRVALCGLLLGISTGFLGIGAGILGVPLFMYIIGLPLKNAAATDTVAMIIIGSSALFAYTISGRVEITAVLILLAAVTIGSRIGSSLPVELGQGDARIAFSSVLAVSALAVFMSLGVGFLTYLVLFIAALALILSLTGGLLLFTGKIRHATGPGLQGSAKLRPE